MPDWRDVSQLPRATGAESRKRLLSQPVESAGGSVLFDLLVEMNRFEFLEPGAKARELIHRQLGCGFFEILEIRRHGLLCGRKLERAKGFEPSTPTLARLGTMFPAAFAPIP